MSDFGFIIVPVISFTLSSLVVLLDNYWSSKIKVLLFGISFVMCNIAGFLLYNEQIEDRNKENRVIYRNLTQEKGNN